MIDIDVPIQKLNALMFTQPVTASATEPSNTRPHTSVERERVRRTFRSGRFAEDKSTQRDALVLEAAEAAGERGYRVVAGIAEVG